MAGEDGCWPFLPRTSRVQGSAFAPALAPCENQRNYVFVDDRSCQRRPQRSRACEGCRRRKVKCDAVTTKSWPCAACTRLKLNCVPLTSSYSQGSTPSTHSSDTQDLRGCAGSEYQSASVYSAPPLSLQTALKIDSIWPPDLSASNLAVILDESKIDYNAVAPCITNQKKTLSETPAVEEPEVHLPQCTCPNRTVRIPPEIMPPEHQALYYFNHFFTNIHPYAPVVNRAYFYQQWHMDRESISPLLLEAIFACSSLILGDTKQGNRWLALASKHEESFRDAPRLSTIQAVILIMKARELLPKRGYFYRSWVTVVNLVAMAKDLELDGHLKLHQLGEPCGSSIYECATRTRVWHLLFVLEIMTGRDQGRSDFSVDLDTVDLNIPRAFPGLDDTDLQVTRQFAYFMHVAKNIRATSQLYTRLKREKKDWAVDVDIDQHNQSYSTWLRKLPSSLQMAYLNNTSPPRLPSHFVGNLHCYHYFSVLVHHRPQLWILLDVSDGSWKQHMTLCYSAAKKICRLQEAVLQDYGLPGLLCMQRGISFAIDCILTCIILHLAAITSPDPDINGDARDLFVRHMRILEQCIALWPMPEIHAKVDEIRKAFSVDTSRSFELRPSLLFPRPAAENHPEPPEINGVHQYRALGCNPPIEQLNQIDHNTRFVTPLVPVSGSDPKYNSSTSQSLAVMAAHQNQPPPSTSMQPQEQLQQWKSIQVLNQRNVASGMLPLCTTTQPSSPLGAPRFENLDLQPQQLVPQSTHTRHPYPSPHASQTHHILGHPPPSTSYGLPAQPCVTTSKWQDIVADSSQDGFKRRWIYDGPGIIGPGRLPKRTR